MLTIFTPTYNRAYILPKLYASLCSQTCKEFEWVVVDDGSTDETTHLVNQWQRDGMLNINYIVQANGGKHRAINNGVRYASGELFFIVDSDDYLTDDAVERIEQKWSEVRGRKDISGLCFRRVNYTTGTVIGKPFPQTEEPYATTFEIHYKWGIQGDKAEVFRTDLVRQNPFPEIAGERFMTEAYIWNQIAGRQDAKLYCVEAGIYMCNYLEDGLTANFKKLLRNNPQGYIRYYWSLFKYSIIWNHPIDLAKITVRLLQSYFYRMFQKVML